MHYSYFSRVQNIHVFIFSVSTAQFSLGKLPFSSLHMTVVLLRLVILDNGMSKFWTFVSDEPFVQVCYWLVSHNSLSDICFFFLIYWLRCTRLYALTAWFRYCYEEDCTKEDPLSQESFRKLAMPLPYSKQHHSKLVCYITKELMDTENPPLVLPNGYVYSTKVCLFIYLFESMDIGVRSLGSHVHTDVSHFSYIIMKRKLHGSMNYLNPIK